MLQRDTLRLGNKEVHERYAQDHQAGEEKIHAVTHRVEHLRRKARDDEVPEPVVCGGGGLTQGTRVLREHLRVDDPGGAVPRGGVEGGPEVEEEDGGDAAGGEARVGVVGIRAGDADVGADVPHAEGATGGTDHEELCAAEAVDEPEEPDDGYDCFDDAEDAGGEEAGACSGDADGFEDGGTVVVDCVDAAAVLEEEEHAAEEEAPKDFALFEGCEGAPEAGADVDAVVFDLCVDGCDFFDDVEVGWGEVADPAEVLHSLFTLSFGEEPAGGFLHPDGAEEKAAGGDQLHGKGDDPLLV